MRKRLIGCGLLFAALALAGLLGFTRAAAAGSDGGRGYQSSESWMYKRWRKALDSPMMRQIRQGKVPREIPAVLEVPTPTGMLRSIQPDGPVETAEHPFFADLGENGRTCFTCHQPQSGWSITPQDAWTVFLATQGSDPLFAPVDGVNCPDTGESAATMIDKLRASSQLLERGNFRIFLPLPDAPEWEIELLRDPYGCNTSPEYGLPSGFISVYRRPLPSASVDFTAPFNSGALNPSGTAFNLMWDAREPDLEDQFINATLSHAQTERVPTHEEVVEGVEFQQRIFAAQSSDLRAGSLEGAGALGGPGLLPGLDPGGLFTPPVGFDLFDEWMPGKPASNAERASIARGEKLFNEREFFIVGVAGLNDAPVIGQGETPIPGTCSTCHNNANVGNDFFLAPKHLGIGSNAAVSPLQANATALPPAPDLPLFRFLCPPDSIPFFENRQEIDGVLYDVFETTDPGVGFVTGKCEDLGKMKVPPLRAIGARPPFFHGGEARTMAEVVNFYDVRFQIGLSRQDKTDLTNFLNSL